VETGHVGLDRDEAFVGDRAHELAQEQRIAARFRVAGSAEVFIGIGREALAQKCGGRLNTQRRGPDHDGHRVGDDLGERPVLAGLLRLQASDHRNRQPLDPRQQVSEPAQRRQIGPVQVIEHEQERPARGEVRGQPVETVQCRERRVAARIDGDPRRLEERRRECGGACKQLGPLLSRERDKQRFEQLPHHPIGERALELGAARTQHLQTGLLTEALRLRQQRRLADSRRPLDREKPATVADPAKQIDNGRHLGVALEELELTHGRLPALRGGSVTGRHWAGLHGRL
jgi:hypothetical protein